MLTCDEINNLIHAYVDEELDLVRSLDIERHVESCAACAGALRQLHELRQALRQPELYHRAGAGVRERILASLPEKPSTATPRRSTRKLTSVAVIWAVAASLAFVAVSIWAFVHSASAQRETVLANAVVAGHVRSLLAKHLVDVASSDRHTVKPWFHGQVAFAPPVPAPAGYALIGGRLDYLDKQTVVALVYKRDKHIINLFIWPATGATDEPARASSGQGYQLLHWARDGFRYWAISDMSAAGLREFADRVRG